MIALNDRTRLTVLPIYTKKDSGIRILFLLFYYNSIVFLFPFQIISRVTGTLDSAVITGSSAELFLSSQIRVNSPLVPKGYFSTPWRSVRFICHSYFLFDASGLIPKSYSNITEMGISPVQPTKSPNDVPPLVNSPPFLTGA